MSSFARYYFRTDGTRSTRLAFQASASWVSVAARATFRAGGRVDARLTTHHDGSGAVEWQAHCDYELVFATAPIEEWTLRDLQRPGQPGIVDRGIVFVPSRGFVSSTAVTPVKRATPGCLFEVGDVRSLV